MLKIASISFLVISTLTAIGFYTLYNHFDHWSVQFLMIPLLPGFIVYIILTGDVHFGQGVAGMIGTGLGAWVFWTVIIYFFYTRRKKYKEQA